VETSKSKFIPLEFESLGAFSSNSKKFVDFIAVEWSSLKIALYLKSLWLYKEAMEEV
jgi:hypothetical protein